MKVRRITTTGWSHYVTSPSPTRGVKKVEPIDVVQDKHDELDGETWYTVYDKEGKMNYVRARSRNALSVVA